MEPIYGVKEQIEGFEVEFEVVPPLNVSDLGESDRSSIESEIVAIDKMLDSKKLILKELNSEIDNLTSHADGIDYAMAVTCGLITGMVDSIFVGEWNFEKAKAKANQDVNNRVIDFAKKDPEFQDYLDKKRQSNSELENAIAFLEKKYKLPGDGEYKAFKALGVTDSTHHLDDFSHHPTFVGLVCSVLVQFSGEVKYHCATGEVIQASIQVNEYGNLVSPDKWGKVFAGVINWFFNAAKAIANQKGHFMSDMAGSSTSAGKGNDGSGLPGGLLSSLKELSALPCFRDSQFGENLRKAFQNGIGTGKKQLDFGPFNSLFQGASSKFDMRTEMAITNELKRQAFPVILNEILVRSCFFVRRVIEQMREKHSIKELNLKDAMPLGNRTIARMITIASGTFTTVDMADAAIRSASKSGGFGPAFLSNMILRVNFVGVGRFAVAVGTDVTMGVSRAAKRSKRIEIVNQQIALTGAKIYYKQAEVWIAAENTDKAIEEMYESAVNAVTYYSESIAEMTENMKVVSEKMAVVAKDENKKKEYLRMLRR